MEPGPPQWQTAGIRIKSGWIQVWSGFWSPKLTTRLRGKTRLYNNARGRGAQHVVVLQVWITPPLTPAADRPACWRNYLRDANWSARNWYELRWGGEPGMLLTLSLTDTHNWSRAECHTGTKFGNPCSAKHRLYYTFPVGACLTSE